MSEQQQQQYEQYVQFYEQLLNEIHPIEKIQQSIGIISFMFCMSVIFICCYKRTNLVMGKPFVKIIVIIAICDSLAALGFSFGYPQDDLCTVQAVLILYFERLSWIYTTILVYQLQKMVIHRSIIKSRLLHVAAISLNSILFFLPFSTDTFYGSPALEQGLTVCSMRQSNTQSQDQTTFNWLLELNYFYFLCLFIILLFYGKIFLRDRYPDGFFSSLIQMKMPLLTTKNSSPIMNDVKITMSLYVMAMIISWTGCNAYGIRSVHAVDSQVTEAYLEQQKELVLTNDKLDCLSPSYGLFLALIFYARTKQARIEYYKIFINMLIFFGLYKKVDDDNIKKLDNNVSRISELSNIEVTSRESHNIENHDDEDNNLDVKI